MQDCSQAATAGNYEGKVLATAWSGPRCCFQLC